MTSGKPVTATISVPGQVRTYTFQATSGKHITFSVTASAWGASGGAVLSFMTPTGGGDGYCYINTAPTRCDFVPSVTGKWTATVTPSGSSVGSATFTFANDQNGGTLISGKAVTTKIHILGQYANYTFAATNGKHVTFGFTASTWGTGGGAVLSFTTPTGGGGGYCYINTAPTRCDFVPSATGKWTATISPSGLSLGGAAFTFANDQNGGTLISGKSVTTKIHILGQYANYTFAATNGKQVTFDVTASSWGTGGGAVMSFTTPTGGGGGYCYINTAPTRCDFVPSATGKWTATISPSGLSLGSATFTFT